MTMKFILITGPPASGKMTVGKALAKRTGLKLFHNHMSIELVNNFFDFGTEGFRKLDKLIRFGIFNEVSQSDLPGLIFTLVWAFDIQDDWDYVNEILAFFNNVNDEVYIVELEADLDERLRRNKQPDRIKVKQSKKDIVRSEEVLLNQEGKYRMNSVKGEMSDFNFYKIDNTNLSPEVVVDKVLAYFNLGVI